MRADGAHDGEIGDDHVVVAVLEIERTGDR